MMDVTAGKLGQLREIKIPILWALPLAFLYLLLRAGSFLRFVLANPDSFTTASLSQIATHGLNLGFVLLLFGGFLHFGGLLLRPFSAGGDDGALPLFSILIGEALFAYLLLAAGLAGRFQKPLFVIVFLILTYGALRELPAWREKFAAKMRRSVPHWEFLLYVLVSIALLRIFVAACAPPTDWDSLSYHLTFPKLFLAEGKIVRIPGSYNYPLNTEMLYTLALCLRDDLAAQLINSAHALLLLLVTAQVARFYFPPAALLSAAVLALQPVFQRAGGNALTDFSVSAASLLAFYAFLRSGQSGDSAGRQRWLLLAGCSAGIAAGNKITGLWTISTLLLLESPASFRRREWKPLLHFAAGAFLFSLPWYLKSFLWTGNPLWPYLGGLFGATGAELEAWHRLRASVTEGIDKTPANLILLPFKLVSHSGAFLYKPLYLMLPFLFLFAVRWSRRERSDASAGKILSILLLFTLQWFFIYQSWRYLLPVIPLLAVLSAAWALMLLQRQGFVAVLAAVLLFSFVPFKEINAGNEWFAALALRSRHTPGMPPRDRYLETTLGPYYRVCRFASETLPDESKLLFYRDVRGYYVDQEFVWGDPLNLGVVRYSQIKDGEELYQTLRGLGVSHILYNPHIGGYKGEEAYFRRADELMDEVLRKKSHPLYSAGGITLYALE